MIDMLQKVILETVLAVLLWLGRGPDWWYYKRSTAAAQVQGLRLFGKVKRTLLKHTGSFHEATVCCVPWSRQTATAVC